MCVIVDLNSLCQWQSTSSSTCPLNITFMLSTLNTKHLIAYVAHSVYLVCYMEKDWCELFQGQELEKTFHIEVIVA